MLKTNLTQWIYALILMTGLILNSFIFTPHAKANPEAHLSKSYNQELIRKFYTAFKNNDGKTMITYYHKNVTFYDPAFGQLNSQEAKAMWLMLMELGNGQVRVEFNQIKSEQNTASAHWEAWYTFSATNQKVHNIIDAQFEIKDGLIYHHKDSFDFHRWSSMALGFMGSWFGGQEWFQDFMRSRAKEKLHDYMKANNITNSVSH